MKKITLNLNEKKKDEDNIDYMKTNKDNIMNIVKYKSYFTNHKRFS